MPYRNEVAVRRAGEAAFSYYECVKDHDDCPVCGEWVGRDVASDIRRVRCYPEKRLDGSPWWRIWRQDPCPLGGVHDHYACRQCHALWVCFHIDMQPSAKIIIETRVKIEP